VSRFSRLLLASVSASALLLAACVDETTGPEPQLTRIDLDAPGVALGFTRCTPQPFAADTARVGPSGGVLKAGRHTLRVPAGALKRSVLITMQAPSDSLNYVVFGPEGLTFESANLPTLVMSYRNCSVTKPAAQRLEIVYVNDALTAVLDTTEAVVTDTLGRTVGGRLRHFSKYVLKSRYAVAY
jgi:hypothetical protein